MAVCTGGVQIGRITLRRGRIEFDVPRRANEAWRI